MIILRLMSCNLVSLFWITLVGLSQTCSGYNILVTVLGMSGSHNLLMYRFGELLADSGHNVTMLQGQISRNTKVPKLSKINKEIVYKAFSDDLGDEFDQVMSASTWDLKPGVEGIMKILPMMSALPQSCDNLLDDTSAMAALNSTKFDVIVVHQFDLCSVGLPYLLGIKGSIQFSTGFMLDHHVWYSGAPFPTAAVPCAMNNAVDRMNFQTRFMNTLMWAFSNAYVSLVGLPVYTSRFTKRYGPNFPSLRSQFHEFQLYFTNSDNLIDFPRPTMPNTIEVGGFMMNAPGPSKLTEEWKAIVEDTTANKHGFVIFSMGSVVDTKTMPKNITMTLFNSFRKLQQKVIWRFEGHLPEAAGTNVILTKWMPQTDLLTHKNCRAFVTHGGFNSVMESAYAGIPLLVMPMFGDQYGNAMRVVRAGYGLDDDIKNTDEAKFGGKLSELVNNPTYMQNAKRLSKMFKMKPTNTRELAVRWVEFLAEFQTIENFQSSVKYLHLYQYFLLDVLAVLALIFGLIGFCCCRVTRACYRGCCSKTPKSKKD